MVPGTTETELIALFNFLKFPLQDASLIIYPPLGPQFPNPADDKMLKKKKKSNKKVPRVPKPGQSTFLRIEASGLYSRTIKSKFSKGWGPGISFSKFSQIVLTMMEFRNQWSRIYVIYPCGLRKMNGKDPTGNKGRGFNCQ